MSISPVRVQLLANTEQFCSAMQRAITLIEESRPLIMRAHWAMRRSHARQVTRAKQRRNW